MKWEVAYADERCPTNRQAATPKGANAIGDDVGIAVDDLDVFHGDAELVGDNLRKRRLVALAMW